MPIVIEPWVALATAGQEITIRPMSHVRGGNGTLRLNAVPAKAGSTIEPSFEAGTFTFSSDEVRTHYVEFTVTDGDQTATGLVRIDVAAPPDANTRPITVPKTIFVTHPAEPDRRPDADRHRPGRRRARRHRRHQRRPERADPGRGARPARGARHAARARSTASRSPSTTASATASPRPRARSRSSSCRSSTSCSRRSPPTTRRPCASATSSTSRCSTTTTTPTTRRSPCCPNSRRTCPTAAVCCSSPGDRLRYLAPQTAGNYIGRLHDRRTRTARPPRRASTSPCARSTSRRTTRRRPTGSPRACSPARRSRSRSRCRASIPTATRCS